MDVLLFYWSHSKWVSFVGRNAWDGNLFFFICLSMPFRLNFGINCKRCLWNESLALFFWLRLTFPLCAPLATAISIGSVLPMVVALEMGPFFLFPSVSFRNFGKHCKCKHHLRPRARAQMRMPQPSASASSTHHAWAMMHAFGLDWFFPQHKYLVLPRQKITDILGGDWLGEGGGG